MQFSSVVNRLIVKAYFNSIFTNDLKRKDFFWKMFIQVVADLVTLTYVLGAQYFECKILDIFLSISFNMSFGH